MPRSSYPYACQKMQSISLPSPFNQENEYGLLTREENQEKTVPHFLVIWIIYEVANTLD